MTVGIAAITEDDTDDPKVIVSADRLLTTRQQSAIEHEHPETKLTEIAEDVEHLQVLAVYAGSVTLAETLNEYIENVIQLNKDQDNYISVRDVASIAAQQYRQLVQNKIENIVLSTYGLELDDLSRQHQFKDDFLNDVLDEVGNVEQQINQNLRLLMGGVDASGAAVYEIGNNDVTGHNNMGYATIGSGQQPAQSEFIKSEYGKSEDFDSGLATVTAANYRAQQARGVGGTIDVGVIGKWYTQLAHPDTVEKLIEREKTISEIQESVKYNWLDHEHIEWRHR